jgi:hypothetical protein
MATPTLNKIKNNFAESLRTEMLPERKLVGKFALEFGPDLGFSAAYRAEKATCGQRFRPLP